MTATTVLVAERSRARFFYLESLAAPLVETETFANPEGREHEGDLVSDRPGHLFDGGGTDSHGRHAAQPPQSASDKVAEDFAKLLCRHAEKMRQQQPDRRWVVVASPEFLGLLRKHWSSAFKACIVGEVAKNVAKLDPQAIRGLLPESVAQ